MNNRQIILKKVRVHNLKSVDFSLNPRELVVFTGVSGSGKSSLAFDTLYVEGQRRYIESLSTFARRSIGDMAKPDVEHVEGMTPTISIEQKTAGKNPRSTVGTMTEIYDYLRVLFARVGTAYCPISGEAVTVQSKEAILARVMSLVEGTKLHILAPYAQKKKGEFKEDFNDLLRKGYMRARVDGQIHDLNEEIHLEKNIAHDIDVVVDRVVLFEKDAERIAESLLQALELGEGVCKVFEVESEKEHFFSMHSFSKKSGVSYAPLEPKDFSFNSPSGMCPKCQGLGIEMDFDLSKIIDDNLSLAEDCCSIASSYETVRFGNICNNLAKIYKFSVDTPWKDLSKKAQKIFLYGTESKWTRMSFVHPVRDLTWVDRVEWKGVIPDARKRYAEAKSDAYKKKMAKLMCQQRCTSCNGARLKDYPAAALVGGKTIHALCHMTIVEALSFFKNVKLNAIQSYIAKDLLNEISQRLTFLVDVGLNYLSLERTAPTLSGGEAQRVRLASQIGCGLVGVTYILDEPSIGLHPRDNIKLIQTLKHLRDKGNTVVVVEHDEETMYAGDRIVDFGPGAGQEGGRIVADGSINDLKKAKDSITGQYLSGKLEIAVPKNTRKKTGQELKIKGATHHNLKDLDVNIPLSLFVVITGVSGSGKSSLISDTLYPYLSNKLHKAELSVGACKEILGIEHLDKVISIDQSPIGRIPRSNPATYIKLFDEIRDLFSRLPESIARGYRAGRFSFNVKEGSCSQCSGMGQNKIDMDFIEDEWVTCTLCKGKRFDQETLTVLYKGKSIFDVLEMTVDEALVFFENIPSIHHRLNMLSEVGMGYIQVGQSSTTLSGGEAQRIKLAKELIRPATGRTLYLLDEPTTGLHFHDIKKLLKVLHELVDRGNTVLVIEHNTDVIKTADWIIDLGPEGGEGGGDCIAKGTPKQIAKKNSPTGVALAKTLNKVAVSTKTIKEKTFDAIEVIDVKEASQHNLKDVSVVIPRNKLTVCTGPSGSGKSSFAFDTVYAEGQRRYIESLSPYARQFVKQMPKPSVTRVEGLSPAIAIEQKSHAGNPRSTVGTMTEIYDYLRVLYSRLGVPHCPETGEVIKAISKEHVVEKLLDLPEGERIHILSPLEQKKGDIFHDLKRQGFMRVRLNGTFYELDEDIPFDRRRKNALFLVVDRLKVSPGGHTRLFEAVEMAAHFSKGKIVVHRENGKDTLYNLTFAVESTGKAYPEITPHSFSFNTISGMCQECQGLGMQHGCHLIDYPIVANMEIGHIFMLLWGHQDTDSMAWDLLFDILDDLGIATEDCLASLTYKQTQSLMNGEPRLKWKGINSAFVQAGRAGLTELKKAVKGFLSEKFCGACEGTRLNPLSRAVTINSTALGQLCDEPIDQVLTFIKKLPIDNKKHRLLLEVKKQLISRLQFLCDVGLSYLSLARTAPSLSGGEAQRIRLARQLGSGISGVLYVLDEPTIGLHPYDNSLLNKALEKLKDLGNTLLMVEHDPLTVETADYVLEFGPKSGKKGGTITAQGTLEEIKNNPDSVTGAYLNHTLKMPPREKQAEPLYDYLEVDNASIFHLKNFAVSIPLAALTCITGVSGSGKSTLMHHILLPGLQKALPYSDHCDLGYAQLDGMGDLYNVIYVNQNPIGSTSRSDVGTYVDVLPGMREFFSSLPLASVKGFLPRYFSYNHRKGMCTKCWGLGYKKVEMHFMPAIKVTCDNCKGMRLNKQSLEVTYKGKNFGQYLQMTIDELSEVFASHRKIMRAIKTLQDVGLGYLQVGQEVATVSGGEAQRLKLAKELRKYHCGATVYLFDEPTTGLHSSDIAVLLKVLYQLVEKGNTVILIEHNLDVIAQADCIIDMGPGAGDKGGKLIAYGTPDELIEYDASLTAKYLNIGAKSTACVK